MMSLSTRCKGALVDVFDHGAYCAPSATLLRAGVDVVTLGQYMRPTKRHMAVAEYVTPATFAALEASAKDLGFLYVAAGPLVRSSYRAGEYFLTNVLRQGAGATGAAGVAGAAPADARAAAVGGP